MSVQKVVVIAVAVFVVGVLVAKNFKIQGKTILS